MAHRRSFIILRQFVALALILIWCGTGFAAPTFHQTPIMLKTADLLPASLIKGDNYRIAETVQNDGVINTYQLDTDDGFIFVESTAELLVRINELKALAKMNEMERKGVFKDSLVSGVKAPVKLVGNLVTSPVESTKNIAKGTGGFISNVGRSIFSRDPHQDNVLKVALGYDATKRKFAYEFMINPYSDYDPVVLRLGTISKAAVTGGILPRAAMAAIGGTVGKALGLSATAKSMKALVRDNPPGALRKINKNKLIEMKVAPELIDVFLDNYNYDPETRTILVGELESMKGVQGRNFFIAAATLANEETSALLYRATAQMMANYHRLITPAVHIGTISGRPFLKNRDDMIILPLPVDYIFWTETVAAKLQAIENGLARIKDVKGKEMWISGKVEHNAGTQVAERGWKIIQDVNQLNIK